MLAEFGNFFLALGLGFSFVQGIAALKGGQKTWSTLCQFSAFIQGSFISAAFLTLIVAFLVCDFSLLVVSAHNHTLLPWYYRIAATWGNHEGSLLLFSLVLSWFNMALAHFLPHSLKIKALFFHSLLLIGFLGLVLTISNPFSISSFLVSEGDSLNPLLQDKGLLLHPPLLYIGYGGLSAPFSLALALLWEKYLFPHWNLLLKPWVLSAWAFLTIGITLGSWWAYYELGWGGWWFWDPVENISLMPWLAATALLHSILTKKLYHCSLFLCLFSFSLSLVGTFLLRSGLVISVHSFAIDPTRNFFMVNLIGIIIGGAFSLWTWRVPSFSSLPLSFFSREGWLWGAVLFFCLALGVLMLGTFYPLGAYFLQGHLLSIGAPYFEKTLIPLALPLFFLLPLGCLLRTKEDASLSLLLMPFTAALAILLVVLYWMSPPSLLAIMGISLATWVISGTCLAFLKKRLSVGATFAHMGVGLSLLGVSVGGGFRQDTALPLGVRDTLEIANLPFTFQRIDHGESPLYVYERAQFTYAGGTLSPERRLYTPQYTLLSETAIATNGLRDIYMSLGPYQGNGKWLVRVAYIPLSPWIWLGGVLMSIGAIVSLFSRSSRRSHA